MKEEQDEKVPLFTTWTKWYVFVLAFHLLLVVLFKLFTNYFA